MKQPHHPTSNVHHHSLYVFSLNSHLNSLTSSHKIDKPPPPFNNSLQQHHFSSSLALSFQLQLNSQSFRLTIFILGQMGETVDCATQTYDDRVSEDGDGSEPVDAIKKMVNPRAEIDTSPPFESVEEAVIRFGGRGFWIPRQMLAAAAEHDYEGFDVHVLEEHTAEMLKDLDLKEQETHDVLKELELTKRLLEDLKMKVQREASDCTEIPQLDLDVHMPTPPDQKCANKETDGPANDHTQLLQCSNLFSPSSAALIMMEVKQAKLNLSQSTNDLAAIRASVESLNKKMEKEKTFLEKAQEGQSVNPERQRSAKNKQDQVPEKMQAANNAEFPIGSASPLPSGIARELQELNYEAEQFMKTAEAAKGEVLKAMSDVEQTKSGLKLIEMRWVAAKKMEEAAKAAEAVALAEINTLSSAETGSDWFQQKPGRISLSVEEYSSLADKARRADTLLKQKDLDFMLQRSTGCIPRASGFDRMDERAEERLSKMAFEEVLSRVEAANRRKLATGEPIRRYGSERGERKLQSAAHNIPLNFRNSYVTHHRRDSRLLDANELNFVENGSKPVLRPTTSIGDILSSKLVLRDDLDVERQGDETTRGDRQRVSLNQMLNAHRGDQRVTSPPRRNEKRNGDRKHFFSKRKALGFVHISLPMSKQSKSKIQAVNLG